MGKNKLSSGLINVVTYDTENNISLNSGSNLLMSLSGSGKVTIPGNLVVLGGISGSSAESSSYALNADKIDNLDSTQLVLTSSFNSYTSSASSSLGSLSGSIATTTSNLSSSIGSLSSSVATTTNTLSSSISSSIGSLSSSVATTTSGFSSSVATTTSGLSSSIATTTSGLGGRITTIEGRYATTGSNIFVGSQVITGSLYITNDMVVQGCSCLQNITASAVSIGTNTVVLNTATPAVRFAGISVQDSGSNAGVTGSIFWDGLCNKWIYSNPNGFCYSGGMLLSGPRNTGTIGNESPLTCNYIAKSGGGDHLYDSCIYEISGSVGINCSSPGFNLDINGELGFNSNISSGPAPAITATQNGTGYLFVGKNGDSNKFRVGPSGYVIVDENSNNVGLTVNQAGSGYSAVFCGGNVGIGVTAPTLKLDVRGTMGVPGTSGTSQYGYLRLTSNAGSSRTLDFGGYDSPRNYAMWMQATDWSDLSINVPLILNPNGGNIGIGTCTPGYKLDVNGEVAISPNTAGKNTFILTTNASNDGRLLIKSDTTNKVDIQSNGASYFMGGNIGINCISPNYKLHVNGCTSIDGNLRMGSGYSSGNSTDPGITVQGYTNAGIYFANCGVGLGGGSSTNLLFLSNAGNVSIGTESAYGKLSVVSSDDTVLSSAIWGGANAGGIHATIYNISQCVNSIAGLKLITRNSGASLWGMYNISTGASTGDLIFGHGSGGSGCEKLRIVSSGNIGINNTTPCGKLQITLGKVTGGCFRTSSGGEAALTIEACSNSYIQFMNCSNGQTGLMFGNECREYSGMIWYRHDSKQLMLGAGGTETMYVCGGNVGIGTASPTAKLEVIGGTSNINGYADGTIQVTGLSPIAFVATSNLNPSLNRWGFKLREVTDGDFSIYNYRQSSTPLILKDNGAVGIGTTTPFNKMTVRTGAGNNLDIFDTGTSFGIGMQVVNDVNTVYKSWDFYASKFQFLNGVACFAQKPAFPGASLTCTYTCTYSSYTAGCWLGLFAGDNGFNGAYAFTVVGQFNLGGSGLYSINYSSVPYIHKSDSIGSTNGNDFYWLQHNSSGHADNGALVCFRRARYSGNTPVGNRTEFCMNVSYSNSFTATTYVLAWV